MEMLRCQNRQRFGAGESRVLHPGLCQLEGPRFVSGRVRALAEGLEVAGCRSEIRGGEGLVGSRKIRIWVPRVSRFSRPGRADDASLGNVLRITAACPRGM